MSIRAKPKKLTRRIAIAVAAAMISTSIVPSVSLAEELQLSDETKQNLIDVVTDQTSENEVAITDSVEQLNEVVPNEELVSSTSTSLIINSTDDMTFSDEAIVSVVKYDNYYVVTYDTAENAKIAFDTFTSQGIAVEYNNSIDKPEDVKEEELDKVENTSDEVESTEADTAKKTITVAVLDTGIADVSDDELLKDMVLEGYSVIDDSVYDNNGHGTVMANIIASSFKDTEMYSDTEIKILPVKVLDENGNGSVLSVYMGMEYALSHDADVINLSISGLGNSNILTNEINKAYNQGVTTVVAAGNNSDDVTNYIPGNIDTAITVSAIAERDNEKVFAEYSNHGSFVDFSAMGTYEMTYTDEAGEEIITSVNGTSVASAYVTSYVAMLKALGREDVSETDVYTSLQASVEDLGEEGFDEYFGFGYLEKENIKEIKEHTADKEKDVDLEENEDDGNQSVNASGWFYSGGTYYIGASGWGELFSSNWNAEPSAYQGLKDALNCMALFNVNNITLVLIDDVYCGTESIIVPDNYTVKITTLDQNTIRGISQTNNATSESIIKAGHNSHITIERLNFYDGRTLIGDVWARASIIGGSTDKYSHSELYAYNCTFNSTNGYWMVASGCNGNGNWTCNNQDFRNCTFYYGNGYNTYCLGLSGDNILIDNCRFYGNKDLRNGTAINLMGAGYIRNTIVTNGGGIINGKRNYTIAERALTNDYAEKECAISCNDGNFEFTNVAIYNDLNYKRGNAIWISAVHSNNTGGVNSGYYSKRNLPIQGNVTLNNCNIGSNYYNGVSVNQGCTLNVNNSSNVYNGKLGITNHGGAVNMSSGTVHDCSDKGIFNESGTVTIDRNAAINIYQNQTGIWNQGTCNIDGGSYWNGHDTIGGIRSNTGQGIVNYGTLTLWPDPANNKRIDIAQNGYNGIYNEGIVNDYGAYIWSNNHAGVVNGADGTTNPTYTKTSGNFDNNEHEGLVNRGTATIINSNIYNNGSNGIANHKNADISNSAIYNNGLKSDWAVAGVYNGSNITLTNNTIRNNRFINAWNNVGTMTINGGSNFNNESEQTTNFGVWNNDTVNIKNGSFYGFTTDRGTDGASCLWNCKTANISGGNFNSSHYGLVNWSTLNQSGGNSNGNSVYDVYQSGEYNVAGSAVAQKVFLTRGHIINNTNVLDNHSTGNNRFTIFVEDKSVGRNVVKAWAGWDTNYANGHFVNGDKSVSDTNAVAGSAAIHRVSDLTNAPVDGYDNRGDDMYVNNHYGNTAEGSKYLILTAKYELDYDPYENIDRNIYDVDENSYKPDEKLYWNEAGNEYRQPFKYDQRPVIYFN